MTDLLQAYPLETPMLCTNCGSALSAQAAYCGTCGQPTATPAWHSAPTRQIPTVHAEPQATPISPPRLAWPPAVSTTPTFGDHTPPTFTNFSQPTYLLSAPSGDSHSLPAYERYDVPPPATPAYPQPTFPPQPPLPASEALPHPISPAWQLYSPLVSPAPQAQPHPQPFSPTQQAQPHPQPFEPTQQPPTQLPRQPHSQPRPVPANEEIRPRTGNRFDMAAILLALIAILVAPMGIVLPPAFGILAIICGVAALRRAEPHGTLALTIAAGATALGMLAAIVITLL
ncbi:MAG TPA: hypothetical protein VFW27_00575 [Actinoplanes sp.]|nr:hypothetical protein [Actinoplanes sp.]